MPLLDHLRAVKTSRELRVMRRAAEITSRTFLGAHSLLCAGLSEQHFARRIAGIMKSYGAEALAFPVIVAFGSNTAHIHHIPTAKKLQRNEIVMLDFGAVVEGFCSDMTRTFFFGSPTKKFTTWYERVLEAQTRALCKVRDGVKAAMVDRAARNYLSRFSGGAIPHGVGHGVGRVIHEWPSLRLRSQDVLREGMAVTVEPGVYFKGWGGIRIEDTVVVTKRGGHVITRALRGVQEIALR